MHNIRAAGTIHPQDRQNLIHIDIVIRLIYYKNISSSIINRFVNYHGI